MKENIVPNTIPTFEEMFSVENLLKAFFEFRKGKRNKGDVAFFTTSLFTNISSLHKDIMEERYRHGKYYNFKINDPKPRDIHKASVRDRIIHHTVTLSLRDYFEDFYIHDSYSCRKGKGTLRALNRFENFSRKISANYTQDGYVLKCDIKKCFTSIDHNLLKKILRRHILCRRTMMIIESIIDSFSTNGSEKGLPLGNLTSQVFINIYMNELDQYVKRDLKIKYYIRYSDDFVFFSDNKTELKSLLPQIDKFLNEELRISLHPKKILIKSIYSGIDFLGWVHFPEYRILRTKTKRRMLKRLKRDKRTEVKSSYIGLMSQGDSYKLSKSILEDIALK